MGRGWRSPARSVPGGIWVCGRFVRRTVYILTGFGGAAAALALIRTPHVLLFYAAGVLMYDFFTGINYRRSHRWSTRLWVGESAGFDPVCAAVGEREPADQLHDGGGWALPYDAWAGGNAGVDALSSVVVGAALLTVFHRIGATRKAEVAIAG